VWPLAASSSAAAQITSGTDTDFFTTAPMELWYYHGSTELKLARAAKPGSVAKRSLTEAVPGVYSEIT
jgi:hypothetical protein